MARLDPDFPGFGRVYYHCRYIERHFGFPRNCRNALNWLHEAPTSLAIYTMNEQERILTGIVLMGTRCSRIYVDILMNLNHMISSLAHRITIYCTALRQR